MNRALAISLAFWPGLGWAFEPALPEAAQLTGDFVTERGHFTLPTGVFANGNVPGERLSGAISRRSWRVMAGFTNTEALTEELSAQLSAQGYRIIFECDAELCGGFDFRFNTEVLPPPEMFVDLSDFRYLSALKDGPDGMSGAGVLVSRTAQAGMVQVIAVGPDVPGLAGNAGHDGTGAQATDDGTLSPPTETDSLRPDVVAAENIPQWLERTGHIVLSDLEFETGSSRLGPGPFQSLRALADYLKTNPARRIALVGHTDSEGSLEQNIELSRKRAEAVRQRLVEVLGVDIAQLEAQGVGFLSPIASNLTEEGRNANRRVEAVLLSTR